MQAAGHPDPLEEQISQWRTYLRHRQAIHSVDVAELEDHLREQIDGLIVAGLAPDEAFLVAVKRLGSLDALSREFALEHADRLWKQMVVPSDSDDAQLPARKEIFVVFALALMAALAIKLPALFGMDFEQDGGFYALNLSFFVLPFLTAYFVWKRRFDLRLLPALAVPFVVAAVAVNAYPFEATENTVFLAALHLPIALWLVVGIVYAGGRWGKVEGRMDFIRYSGELFIYYVLIALGGVVLMIFLVLLFDAIGIDSEWLISTWLLPCGAAGAVLVATWLVEAKQSVIENMAPVLTRLFSPLFTILVLTFLGALLWTGRGVDFERDMLIAFDLLLIMVLGLLLYSISARPPGMPANAFDVIQVVLVVSTLLANGIALWTIAERIGEYGFTPNRSAALGVNVILLVNLGWSAALYIRFLRGRAPFTSLERWQTNYLPVYAAWAAVVVIVFPPLFGFI